MTHGILAILTHERSAAATLAMADMAANIEQADRIDVLHVRVDPLATIIVGEEILSDARREEIESVNKHEASAVKAIFDAWLADRKDSDYAAATWLNVLGDLRGEVADLGRNANLIVLGKPDPARRPHHTADGREALHAAIFDTGRPFLLTPENGLAPNNPRIAIAWKEGQPAARAVLAALPWLARAKAISIVVVAEDDGSGEAQGAKALLLEHGLDAVVLSVKQNHQNVGDCILSAATELGADLLVMGAYRRNRLLEWVLGGATSRILEATAIPVLMCH